MSYCVNCGVELDGSLKECPLCNTPVINPKAIPYTQKSSPFPKEKEEVEMVQRKDIGILVSIILFSTAVTCGCLNWLVFNGNSWSVIVIGACMVLWVIMLPIILYHKMNVYLSVLLDGMAVLVYLYLITWLTKSSSWFWGLGTLLVAFMTALLLLFTLCVRRLPKSILTRALFSITAIGILCVGIEILVDWYLYHIIVFKWSAIVATVCLIIDIAIITLLSTRRLRNAVRRRLHF